MRNYASSSHAIMIRGMIFLVLLGCGVGAYISVKTLLHAASIRSTVVRLQSYNTAVYKFLSKYDDLPGDIKRAATFGLNGNFGVNGNGDTRLDDGGYSDITESFGSEHHSFWIHLSKAGMIGDEKYDAEELRAEVAYPLTSLAHGGMVALSALNKHYWLLGTSETLGVDGLSGFIGNRLTTEEAKGIDVKMDDGNPLQGETQVMLAMTENHFVTGEEANEVTQQCISGFDNYNVKYPEQACTLRVNLRQRY